MKGQRSRLAPAVALLIFAAAAAACSPSVGSEAWCAKMKEVPAGDWSSNDLTAYTKHCIFD